MPALLGVPTCGPGAVGFLALGEPGWAAGFGLPALQGHPPAGDLHAEERGQSKLPTGTGQRPGRPLPHPEH